MKTSKKINLLLYAVLLAGFLVFTAGKALAADQPFDGSTEWANAKYTINNKSTIIVTFPSHLPENFTNDGSNRKYNAPVSSNGVCGGAITFNSSQSLSSKPTIQASINITFANAQGTPSCVNGGDKFNNNGKPITITNNTTSGGTQPADTGPAKITFNGQTYTQLSTSNGQNRFYGLTMPSSPPGGDCYGGSVIVLANVPTTSNQPVKGTVLPTILNGAGGGELSQQVSYWPNANIPLDVASVGRCHYNSNADNGDHVLVSVKADGTATFSTCSKGDTACKPSSSTDPAGTTTSDGSCEASYIGAAHELNWLFCSLLRGMDSMFNTIYSTISSQLNICTGKSSTTGETCGNNLLSPQVEKSWAVFRDIATALLVIVMLIMVFSQAISIGPLDAYTVRKMLPRLVAMAILIQISWPMLKFFVDISNDLGNGIQQLMLAPFGGAGKLAFDNQIGQVGVAAPSLTITAGAVFTGAVIAFSGITIFGWLLLGASAIASVIVGLLVLLFRQMLIILAIILAPLAFIAYILPGTQQYWKLWKDNFSKLLLMFPLIMAMIAGGKIFASVGANTSGSFLGLVVVLIGFVGPLWFLPKTFKWGGQLFGAAASGAWGATKGLRNAPGKYSLSQAKLNREQRAQDRNARLAENQSTHPRFDRLLAGGYNPILSRRARERRYAANRAQGRKAGDEALAESLTGGQYENLDHPYKIDTLRTVAQGAHDARTGIDGTNNPAAQRWALDELAKYGDWDIISNLRDNNSIDERTWQAFVAKNISAIHQNIPHLSPQRTDLSTQGVEEIPGYKDFEATELREQAENYQVRDALTGARRTLTDPGERLAHRIRHVTRARAALADQQIRRRMTTHQIRELEGIAALDIDSPTAQVINVPGSRESQVVLPSSLQTAEAHESISRELAGPSGERVAQALTERVAHADPTTAQGQSDEAAFATYLQELEAQNSPVATRIRNSLVLNISNSLGQNIHETERAAVEAGLSQADIAIEVAEATRHRDEKMQRLNLSMAAVPPAPQSTRPSAGSPFNTGLS